MRRRQAANEQRRRRMNPIRNRMVRDHLHDGPMNYAAGKSAREAGLNEISMLIVPW